MSSYRIKVVYEIEVEAENQVDITHELCDEILDYMQFHNGDPAVVNLPFFDLKAEVVDCVVSCIETHTVSKY